MGTTNQHLAKNMLAGRLRIAAASSILVCFLQPVMAQDPGIGGEVWEMERLHLAEGRILAGLIETEQDASIQFIEVHRPAGKPMFLIMRTVDRDRIQAIDRVGRAARRQLQERIHAYRNRARIKARREEAVDLHPVEEEGQIWQVYRNGPWFQLRTTLAEPVARRIAVRLDQVFQAYQQVLPSRLNDPPDQLSIVIYGNRDSYITSLRRQGITILNPAFFEPSENRVLAGCAVNEILNEIQATREAHLKIEEQMIQWQKECQDVLNQHERSLRNAPKTERERILKALRDRWAQEKKETKQKIKEIENRNDKLLEDEIHDLVRLLFHESLHAYLENFVFNRDQYDVPGWLNEGLAQIFEDARIEADLLRIDAPDPIRL
ncbi:MAG: hypothetical protein JW829_03890, partial [Pirellulales bacterium]|nr:hypothetical protein [Pirellulales bacterium]